LELDGLNVTNKKVVILAATNDPGSIDFSLLRPGKLNDHIIELK
jgi:ATP-dependent Zn protease